MGTARQDPLGALIPTRFRGVTQGAAPGDIVLSIGWGGGVDGGIVEREGFFGVLHTVAGRGRAKEMIYAGGTGERCWGLG